MNSEIHVREMMPDEEKSVREFFDHNLGVVDQLVFGMSLGDAVKSARKQQGATLVATCEKRIVGTVSVRIHSHSQRRMGLIDAISTDRELRGKGVAKALLNEALLWLEKNSCSPIYATVDRFNSPSWNMFVHRGFSPVRFRSLQREHGFGFFRLWLAEFYFLGGGTFFLRYGEGSTESGNRGAHNFIAAWFVFALILSVSFRLSTLTMVLMTLGVTALVISAHEAAHRIAAGRFGLKTTFVAWDGGLLFSLLLAVLGASYPSYGSTYMAQVDYQYSPKQRVTGLIYTAGPLVSLLFATVCWILLPYSADPLLKATLRIGYITNYVIVLFNLIPIQAGGGFAWDGARIFGWNKVAWSLLVVALAVLILSDILL